MTVDGQRLSLGDHAVDFSIQSCAKPLLYSVCSEELGAEYVSTTHTHTTHTHNSHNNTQHRYIDLWVENPVGSDSTLSRLTPTISHIILVLTPGLS